MTLRFELTPEQQQWRATVRAFLAENADLTSRHADPHAGSGQPAAEWLQRLRRQGWLGAGWPKEYGGLGMTAIDQWILIDEISYAGLPRPGEAITMIGPAIMSVGSEQMKAEWLPRIISGEVEFALGYSEPDAGTDLANLQTAATLDGDEFVINGSKLWNSGGHYATHEWLAVRTDPTAPRRDGISVVIVPLDDPGITVLPIWTWGGVRTNQVFFDDVRVPRDNLVGELHQGWTTINAALDLERIAIGAVGDLRRHMESLVRLAMSFRRGDGTLADDPVVRNRLARLMVDVQAARLLSLRNAEMVDRNEVSAAESSMAKVWTTELRVRMADCATQIMGLYGQLSEGCAEAPLGGEYERMYRDVFHFCFTGGTNEIQRDLIARRGLGLPRQDPGRRGGGRRPLDAVTA